MVGAFSVFVMFFIARGFYSRHLRQLQGFHQAVHSSHTDVDAIITCKNISDLIGAETLVIIGINVEDQGSDLLVFPDSGSSFIGEVLVVGAPVDSKDPAQGFDGVLEPEFVDGV